MSNLGEDPELEERLFCEGCRSGVHGKVLTYDGPEIRRQLDLKELKLTGQCKHCGNPLPKPAAAVPSAEDPISSEPVRRGPGRPRMVTVDA